MHNLEFDTVVITPMGEGRVRGQVAQSDPPKVFVRIPVENLPPEMRTAMQARHQTCAMLEFDLDSLVPVAEGKKITRVTRGAKVQP